MEWDAALVRGGAGGVHGGCDDVPAEGDAAPVPGGGIRK